MSKNPVISLLLAVVVITGLYVATRPESDNVDVVEPQSITEVAHSPQVDTTEPAAAPEEVLTLQPNDQLLTEPVNPKVTLIEYSDFECPACAAFHPLLVQARDEFGDDVQFVFRHFPLTNIHRNADLAHHVAEGASRQGRFIEVHDALYENQRAWADSDEPLEVVYAIVEALGIGLDIEQLKMDAFDESAEEVIIDHLRGGQSIGVEATPTFYLDGEEVERFMSYEELEQVLQDALEAAE